MLNKVQIDLIETIRNKRLATSVYLSDCLVCSKRSVINYVKDINAQYPALVKSTKKGYFLDEELFNQISEEYHLNQQFSSDYRSQEIVRSFFLSDNDSANINTLSFSLYVSDSTIRSDIYSLKKNTTEKISIQMNKASVRLTGSERDIRYFYFNHIYRSHKTSFYDDDPLIDFFPDFDIFEIKKEISRNLDQFNTSTNEYLFTSLLIQVLIGMTRILKNRLLIQEELTIPKFVREKDFSCARKIADYLNRSYRVSYSETEIRNLALLLASYNINFTYSEITLDNLQQYLWPGLYSLFMEITDTLKNRYRIDIFKKPSNAIGLALHLRSLIHRSSVRMFVDNPIRTSIKNLYPISFECAIYMARKIFDQFQVMITEDEITFLAIYVANNMRVYHSAKGKISVLFVIPNYSIISNELYEYYKNYFDSDIKAERISQIEKIDKDQYDLIVSTNSFSEYHGLIPVVLINPFINSTDEKLLSEKINELKDRKRKNYIRNTLLSIMDKDLFITENGSIDDILSLAVERLFMKGIASNDLKEDILIRARLSDVTSNAVALFRPCTSISSSNSLTYVKLKRPVYFNSEKVEAILLLTFNESRFLDYLSVLEYLFKLISDKNQARKLIEADSFDELKALLTR